MVTVKGFCNILLLTCVKRKDINVGFLIKITVADLILLILKGTENNFRLFEIGNYLETFAIIFKGANQSFQCSEYD